MFQRILPALAFTSLIIGCGDNTGSQTPLDTFDDPDAVPSTDPLAEDPAGQQPDPGQPVAPQLLASASFSNPSCDSLLVAFEAVPRWSNGAPVVDPKCVWTFSDGATSNHCAGDQLFAAAGNVGYTLTVTDGTGAIVERAGSAKVLAPLAGSIDFAPVSCGMTFGYSVDVNASSELHVLVGPEDKVVSHTRTGRDGMVEVLMSGTYEVTLLVEDERANGPICKLQMVEKISVVDCQPE